jgi:ribonucleoside-triphosphate reductase
MDYTKTCSRIVDNGEPGFAWLENMQKYSRMQSNELVSFFPPILFSFFYISFLLIPLFHLLILNLIQDHKDARAKGGNPCLGILFYFIFCFCFCFVFVLFRVIDVYYRTNSGILRVMVILLFRTYNIYYPTNYDYSCLVETFPNNHESYEDFKKTLKFAFLYAKTVTLGIHPLPQLIIIFHFQ